MTPAPAPAPASVPVCPCGSKATVIHSMAGYLCVVCAREYNKP